MKAKLLKRCQTCKNNGIILTYPIQYQGYGFFGDGHGVAINRCKMCVHGKRVTVKIMKMHNQLLKLANELVKKK